MEVSIPEYKIAPSVFLNPRYTALIVVDMQVDFASPTGKLFVQESRPTIPKIRSLVSNARKMKVPVIFTQDWHRADDVEFLIWPRMPSKEPGAPKLFLSSNPCAKIT